MAVDSQSLHAYMRDPPDCSEDLSMYINAAKARAKAAGVPDFKHNALYDMFIHELATHFYENRGLSVSGTYQATAEHTAQNITNSYVLQLRYAEEDEVTEGGDVSE